VPHRPTPPPSPPARSRRSAAGRTTRPARPLWAPLLLACAVAAVAFTAAISGGTLPGLSDAASSADAGPRTSAQPAATSSAEVGTTAPVSTVAVPAPTPSTPPSPSATTSATAPATTSAETSAETSTAAAPPSTPEPVAEAPAETTAPAEAPAPPAAAPASAAPGPEGEVLALVNVERAAAGCGALSADEGLASVARAHSADMRDRDYFSHVDPDGLDPFARARAAGISSARAENIAYGQPDAAAVMADWMESPGHRQNILDCGLRTLGVGVATGPGGPWWTQLFGV